MRIAKEYQFEAAHRLRHHLGACRNLHGHSYKLVVEVEGPLAEDGADRDMVVDFGVLSMIVRGILHGDDTIPFDHSVMLNVNDPLCQILEFEQGDETIGPLRIVKMTHEPTAEYMAQLFAGLIQKGLDTAYEDHGPAPSVVRVEVWETATSRAVWDSYDAG